MTPNLLMLALLALAQAPAATPAPSSPAEISTFVEALQTCTPARAATPHPLMRGFIVEHTITGPAAERCDYRQTMPGKMAMVCAFSPEGRKAMASELSVYAKGGTVAGSTSSAKAGWSRECLLELPDGKRQPM